MRPGALATGPADLGWREMHGWSGLCIKAVRGSGKKWVFQQAYESGDLDLEAVGRHASASSCSGQGTLGGCGSTDYYHPLPGWRDVTDVRKGGASEEKHAGMTLKVASSVSQDRQFTSHWPGHQESGLY